VRADVEGQVSSRDFTDGCVCAAGGRRIFERL